MPVPWHLVEAGISTATRFVGLIEAPAALVDDVAPLAAPTKRVRIPFVPRDTWMRAARESCMALSDAVAAAIDAGARPLVLGGECSIVAGTIPAAHRRIEDLTLVYFDAHGDFNTLATTPSHFMGGMCLAHVCGHQVGPLLWAGVRPFPEERVLLVGARQLDVGEIGNLERSKVRRFAFDATSSPAPLIAAARRRPLWIHVDLDVVDPEEMPAVNFPAARGASFAALGDALRSLAQAGTIRGLEVCGYDVRADPRRSLAPAIARAIAPAISAPVLA